MPEVLTDLWPEIETENIVTPLAILRFQAGQLRIKTKGLLEAEVRTERAGGDWIRHKLVVIAASLDRYEYAIATFTHDATLVYPLHIETDERELSGSCSDQVELLATVSSILRSDKVRSVISSLIAQSRDAGSATKSSGEN